MKKNYNMSEYITEQEFKSYSLFFPEIEKINNKEVKILLDLAGFYIQDYIDKPFLREIVTEKKTGSGSNRLFINSFANNIIKVVELPYNIIITDYIYNEEKGFLERINGLWNSNYIYKIQYVTGDLEIPNLIKKAVIITALNLYKFKDYKGIKSLRLDVITMQFDEWKKDIIPEDAKKLLSNWKNELYLS